MKHCHDILLADANEAFCGLLQESIARKGGSADDDMTVIVLRAVSIS